jgi:ubiquinone biosynthesis UbiH/UbiF/VisC/COQ6 family hydroxylase
VRAYALNAASRELLQGLRCWPDAAHATPVLSMQVCGDAGGALQFDAAEQAVQALNWIVDVPTLEGLLAQAVGFQSLIEVRDTPAPAALTVVCEGKASSTRAAYGVDFDSHAYPQWALAARVRCEQAHGQIARQWFATGEGEPDILAFRPLDGPQGTSCARVWSLPPARAQALQTQAEDAFCDALRDASHSSWGALELISERAVWPLVSATARQWCGANAQGAWVLAGDAAHAVHPLAGQGLNLGLGDVACLSALLEAKPYWRSVGDPRLLQTYARERKSAVALIGGAGDALQNLFSQSHPAVQAARNWGLTAFSKSGPLKHWIARRAMGLRA